MRVPRSLGLSLLLALAPIALGAQSVALKPDHPSRYVVQRGDTLWDIAGRFLRDPWLWPEIWDVNPAVRNPHLIYPGDELILSFRDGQPVLQVQRGGQPRQAPADVSPERTATGVVKLRPRVRELPLDATSIPPIPVDAIAQFLSRPGILTDQELSEAPYIVSLGPEHLIAGAGYRVYARGLPSDESVGYAVYRRGKAFRDPDRGGEILGYEALHVADARLEEHGDPASLALTTSTREVLIGDRVLPVNEKEVVTRFLPRAPSDPLDGKIIAVVDGVTQIGQHQTVVLNLGTRDGVEEGHVMAVYQLGEIVRDPFAKETVTLPNARAGVVMVFRPFERVSYALVMEAQRAMHVRDIVTNP